MKNKITIKDKILYLLLPFIIGCSTATATTPKAKSIHKVKISGYSQLDHTEPAIEPGWLRKTPKETGAYFFVGMSNKRSERKDAKNESFNDAMIAFARFCGLNVSVMEEHKDVSIGGNGGVIDTLTHGNSFAKMRAEMFMGNVTVEDRFLERYSNFHGGSFMGHSFVVSTLIKVPQDEMETCRENRKTANAYMEEQSETITKLSEKNTLLENRLQQLERNNQKLAMNQVMQSNKMFEQKTPQNTHFEQKTLQNTHKEIKSNSIPSNILKMAHPHIDDYFSHFTVYQNHTYALTNSCVTWSVAKKLSKEFNSYPVKIDDSKENKFLANYFYKQLNEKIDKVSRYGLRIGLTDLSKENNWKWSDNSNPLFTNWAPGEPNNYNFNEDFVNMMFKDPNPDKKLGTWNDGPGTSETQDCELTIFEWDYMLNWEDNNKIVSLNN